MQHGKKFVHPILTNEKANEYISLWKESLRIEVYSGSPHLELLIKPKAGNPYYKTLGRIRKSLLKKLPIVPMDKQEGFVNVFHYKFI